jgi:CGNR zinc finger
MPTPRDDHDPSGYEILAEIQRERAQERAKGRRRRKPLPIPEFLRDTIYGKHTWSVLLEVLSNPQHRDHNAVAGIVNVLIGKGTGLEALAEATECFRRWARHKPMPPMELWATTAADGRPIVYEEDENIDPVMLALKAFLMSEASWPRVKRCPECGRYFFDRTKRNNARYDSSTCATRVRGRRFRAAHPATE